MEKMSGLILDVNDDQGRLVKEIFPTLDSVPETIKQAHVLSHEERASLPDDVFALVLQDEYSTLRKYACTDRGNTELAVLYFLKTAHKLPEEAQKVAAENLTVACNWYGIVPPIELAKVAGAGLLGQAGKAMNLLTLPSTIMNTKDQIGRNMQVARSSGSLVNPMSKGMK